MDIVNVHQRLLLASPAQAGSLIDTLATPADQLWPGKGWPRMKLDRPLGVGASGGHGPIRYVVESYAPGRSVRFRFRRPHGFDGWHMFSLRDAAAGQCVLEHRIEMKATGRALLLWLLAIGPLHDACLEDALSQAQASLGQPPAPTRWSPWVRLLMRLT